MDTSNPAALLRALLPKVPLMLTTTFSHALSLAPTSHYWDLRTSLVINVLRSFCTTDHPASMEKTQRISLRDPGIKGPMWVSKITLPAPTADDSDIRSQLELAFNLLRDATPSAKGASLPTSGWDSHPVTAEWTGFRSGVTSSAPPLPLSEAEIYSKLMSEVSSPVTILYFHGGAYYLLDPASHRPVTSRLAQLTSGRVLSVRYRLAPQNAFPAGLLDAFVAYLSLLYPPPGALHAPVPASHVIFSGDSAGGGLSLSLLQLLLTLHRHTPSGPQIRWLGRTVALPLPGGVATNSAWIDLTHSMPSIYRNAHYDYLPPPKPHPTIYPTDSIWPTDPPRHDIYTSSANLLHPLVSPITSPTWRGSPPLYLQCGEEMLADENHCLARWVGAQAADVPVHLDYFERMPHCFALVLPDQPYAKKAFSRWAGWCVRVVTGEVKAGERRATVFEAKTLWETELDLKEMGGLGKEEVIARMEEVVRKRAANGQGKGGEVGWMAPKL